MIVYDTPLGPFLEEWREVCGYDLKYFVSQYGRVKNQYGRVLKCTDDRGYRKAYISMNGKNKNVGVHRLVAIAFIENPLNKPFVNHINPTHDYNFYQNLEWSTMSENIRHAYDNGLMAVSNIVGKPKTIYAWDVWRDKHKPQRVKVSVARKHGGYLSTITPTMTGLGYTHIRKQLEVLEGNNAYFNLSKDILKDMDYKEAVYFIYRPSNLDIKYLDIYYKSA